MKRLLFVLPSLLIALHTAPAAADAISVAENLNQDQLIEALAAPAAAATPSGLRGKGATRGLSVEPVAPAAAPSVHLRVQFEFGTAALTESARSQLDELGKALVSPQLSPYSFRITGHTDAVGEAAFNLRLSQQRAWVVQSYLAGTYTIGANRLESAGLGESVLAVPGDPAAAANRRVEITNIGAGG